MIKRFIIISRALLLSVMLVVTSSQSVLAQEYKVDFSANNINHYDPHGTQFCGSDSTANLGKTNTYIAVGNIPTAGVLVGAATYGGSYNGTAWQPSGSNPLTGKTAFAELGNALGNIPNGTKLEITYKGQSVIAEKADTGAAGPAIAGKARAIGLWWETAKLLNFTGGSDVVSIHAVDPATAITPLTGQSTSAGTSTGNPASSCCNTTTGTSSSGGTLVRFLQALADQESSGNIKAVSGTGATGKYQYIDSTWHGSAKQYYPPADQYAKAMDAPEPVQDAVAYLEYAHKFVSFKGDLFKLAISHFYPAANTNPSLLDIRPPGNVITPRQYAEQFISRVNSGAGSKIPILATSAPDFAKYATGVNASGGSVNGTCASNGSGIAAGDIVKTALGLAWPDRGHGKNKSDATPAYQSAMPKYNGATDIDPFSDCGVFVATVMVASGADPQYQKRGTPSQIDYIRAHPEKYTFRDSSQIKSTADLHPGDILVNNGHTYLFTGPYKGSDGQTYNSASASLHDHVPEASNWYAGFMAATKK